MREACVRGACRDCESLEGAGVRGVRPYARALARTPPARTYRTRYCNSATAQHTCRLCLARRSFCRTELLPTRPPAPRPSPHWHTLMRSRVWLYKTLLTLSLSLWGIFLILACALFFFALPFALALGLAMHCECIRIARAIWAAWTAVYDHESS
jgi:hypothetical protein